MPNILDDNFMISKYLKHDRMPESGYTDDAINQALKYNEESDNVMIIPTESLEDLEDQWLKFNEMIKHHRRESDWASLEIFGVTNQEHYQNIRKKLVQKDISNDIDDIDNPIQGDDVPVQESYIDAADSYLNPDAVYYTTVEVDKAREWGKESNRVIIIPTRTLTELEALWDAYNEMIKKHKRESDWMSLELFNMTNQKHYEYLKSQFLKEDIANKRDYYGALIENSTIESPTVKRRTDYLKSLVTTESVSEVVTPMLEMLMHNNNFYEEMIIGSIVSDVIDTELTDTCPTIDIPYGDMPLFSPDEMIDMGVYGDTPVDNYYGAISDSSKFAEGISMKEWFESYRAYEDGFYTSFTENNHQWISNVRNLMHGLKKLEQTGDQQAINARKQSILELGWNPDVEFNDKSRILAREIARYRMANKSESARVIDLREFTAGDITSIPLNEQSENANDMHPVFVVLTQGKSFISPAIKKLTHDPYSHASISLDSSLENMYSFGADVGGEHGLRGGFRQENIQKELPGVEIGVYAFFLKNKDFVKIQNMIDDFKNMVHKTKYSYTNLFTYLFNIKHDKDYKLICSQFVDRCLKAADVDITKRDSSLVAPSTLHKSLAGEKRIYSIYSGLASKYDKGKIQDLVDVLMGKAKPFREQNSMYYVTESSYISGILNNIHNVSTLLEMQSRIDIVKNDTVRRLLEDVLFDSLTIRPYELSNRDAHMSLSEVSSLITQFVQPV